MVPSLYSLSLLKSAEWLTQNFQDNPSFLKDLSIPPSLIEKIFIKMIEGLDEKVAFNRDIFNSFLKEHEISSLILKGNISFFREWAFNSSLPLSVHTLILHQFKALPKWEVFIAAHSLLNSLTIEYSSIEENDLTNMYDYLKGVNLLKKACFRHVNFLSENDKDGIHAQVLSSLINHPSLDNLEYENNGLGEKSVQAIANLIAHNSKLFFIKFTGKYFDDPGIHLLFQSLEDRQSKLTLDLSEQVLLADNFNRLKILEEKNPHLKILLPDSIL